MTRRQFFLASAVIPCAQREPGATRHARGTFDVKVAQQGADDKTAGIVLSRWSLEKQLHGDLDATGKGEMLTASTEAGDSKAYVAIERITGTLHGRAGSFVLMHRATLTPDGQQLTLAVMPGSGTGQLTGLTGTMVIRVEDKIHQYDFEYALPGR
jgi:Protein of unknown function (DUF3224)